MTGHRSIVTVMGYFQAGTLLSSRATELLPNIIATKEEAVETVRENSRG